MAAHAISLIVVSVLASSAAQQNCSETQCKLLPVEGDEVLKFQNLASEKGVRMVYLNLEIGNDSQLHPLESNERFFAKRWVWTQTTSEPMLFFPNDFVIVSLGLLKYQVRYLDVHLVEQPSGCLALLNTSCQDSVVGKTLLGNFTQLKDAGCGNRSPQTDCVRTLRKTTSSKWKYHCCSVQNVTELSGPLIGCGIPVTNGWYVMPFNAVSSILRVMFFLCCPAIPLLFPNFLFNLQHECEKEANEEQQIRNNQVVSKAKARERPTRNRTPTNGDINPYGELLTVVREELEKSELEIPLDDANPITFCTLLSGYAKELPDFEMNFNLKVLFVCFVVLPFFLYLKFILIMFFDLEVYHELHGKISNCRGGRLPLFIVCLIVGFSWQEILSLRNIMAVLGCVTLFVVLLFIRPKDLLYRSDATTFCPISCEPLSLGHEILNHLSVLHHWVYDLTFFILWEYMSALKRFLIRLILGRRNFHNTVTMSRRRRAFYSCCVLFAVLPGLLIGATLAAICLLIFAILLGLCIVLLSPMGTFYFFLFKKVAEISCYIGTECIKCHRHALGLIVFLFSTMSLLMAFYLIESVLNITVILFMNTFLFTIMGLVLNAELVTPYVAFILVVTKNMYLCYSNLQSRYKEVKGMISKHWKENIRELPWVDNSNEETIPTDLFWFVCGNNKSDSQHNVIPLRAEICCMLRDMAIIFLFLFLSLFAILMFKFMNDISVLISTVFVFVSGVIPSLIFGRFTKKEKFSRWNKIKMEKKIKDAVDEYIVKRLKENVTSFRDIHV